MKNECTGDEEEASFSLEDIQPRKARAPAPPKPPSIQKSVQELTQDFKDLLSEKVGIPINMVTPVCSTS